MKPQKKAKVKGHILDAEKVKTHDSYQFAGNRQNLRQRADKNTHNFQREDLGFTNRDTRGYDKIHKGKY